MKTDRQTGASARIASECTEHSRTFRIQLPQVGEWCKKKVAKTPHQCREPSIPYLKKICPKCFANSQKQPPFRTGVRARGCVLSARLCTRARPHRAPKLRRSTCSTSSVRSLHAHTAPPSHTESIEPAQVLSSMVPRAGTLASPESAHMRLPNLSHD